MYRTPPAAEPGLAAETEADGSRWLRCGELFDVLRVPEPAGRWALRRLLGYGQPALMPGPVGLEVAGAAPGTSAPGPGSGTAPALETGPRPGTAPGLQVTRVPGPETAGGACLYLVAPGAKEDLPELLEWLDWGGIDLGLRAYGAGERVRAPRVWLHEPLTPAPEVVALLATVAECCSRRLLGRALPARQ